MAKGLRTICYEEFTLGYSPPMRASLWSAEFLTEDRIRKARTLTRSNTFHEELSLAPQERAVLKDFVRSGYDRGHIAPNGDMSNPNAQNESFSLANMVAQDPYNNQHTWAGIESGTRNYAVKTGSLYVITGPLFNGAQVSFLRDRVAIPTQLFKVLYDPARKIGGVYLVDNTQSAQIAWKTIAEFEQLSGYRLNIGAPPLLAMPKPKKNF
jgi:endonuclease G, mitochondrial